MGAASSGRGHTLAAILLRFVHDIEIGDQVMTPDPSSREVLCGVIAGPYELVERPDVPSYHHVRNVSWLGRVPRSELSQQALRSIGAPSPLYQPAAQAELAGLPLWRRLAR
jgi:restriction system protein